MVCSICQKNNNECILYVPECGKNREEEEREGEEGRDEE